MRKALGLGVSLFALAVQSFGQYRISTWIPGWDANALTSVQVNATAMSESNPTWYQLNADGTLAKKTAAEDPTWRAAMTGTELLPTIQNTVNGSFNQSVALTVLGDPTTRERHAEEIRMLVVNQGYDGADIDYERLPSSARANFTAFVQLLASKLHATGKKLSVTLYSKTSDADSWDGPGGEDYAAIGAVADWVKLMVYDYSYDGSRAGAITPLAWLDQVVTFAQSQIASQKIVVGLPWYGYDWQGTTAVGVTYAQAIATAQANAATINRDANGEGTYVYGNHVVYFQDAASYDSKINLILQKHPGIGGFAHWRSGAEDAAIWTRVAQLKASAVAPPPPPPPPPPATTNPSTLIATGSTWKILDNGTDQATAWRTTAFADTSWKSGAAQLGYGDGDEKTVVSYGPSSTNKYVTTYFREGFDIADPAAYSALNLRLLRDDGAIVYLNGTEIVRSNMPAGAVSYQTLAATTINGADESTNYYTFPVDPKLLLSGHNVVAVEIHQADVTSSDISFDLELTGSLPAAIPAAPYALAASVAGPAQINLSWTDADANETGFAIDRCAGEACSAFTQIAQTAANVTTFADTSVAASSTYSYRVRSFNSTGSSAPSNIATAITPAVAVSSTLIAAGSAWTYLDNGTDQGSAWRLPSFVDTAWKSGNAQFGYGDGDEKTVVSYGPKSRNKFITTYFRQTFTVSDPAAIGSLLLRLMRDDGAVVYINGVEITRSNMPSGTIGYRTFAASTINGADESTFFESNVAASVLVAGTNVIAVEVHQSDATSSDLSFDLELIAK